MYLRRGRNYVGSPLASLCGSAFPGHRRSLCDTDATDGAARAGAQRKDDFARAAGTQGRKAEAGRVSTVPDGWARQLRRCRPDSRQGRLADGWAGRSQSIVAALWRRASIVAALPARAAVPQFQRHSSRRWLTSPNIHNGQAEQPATRIQTIIVEFSARSAVRCAPFVRSAARTSHEIGVGDQGVLSRCMNAAQSCTSRRLANLCLYAGSNIGAVTPR